MYIRVLCTIIYQSDDLALSASDTPYPLYAVSSTHTPSSFLPHPPGAALPLAIEARNFSR